MTDTLNVQTCRIHQAAFDPKRHAFTWCISCDISLNETEYYYFAQSFDRIPPTSGWQIIEKWGKYDFTECSPA